MLHNDCYGGSHSGLSGMSRATTTPGGGAINRLPELTRRERDVLSVLCRPSSHGAPFTEPASIHAIADALGVSEAAVKQHLIHLYDKFGIFEGSERRRVRLANMAISEGAVRSHTPPASKGPGADLLTTGRAAAALRNWLRAYELLACAEVEGAALSAQDLEYLGEAAMMTGRHEESVVARQRAHAIYGRDEDHVHAASVEIALVYNYAGRLNFAQAQAWFARQRVASRPCHRGLRTATLRPPRRYSRSLAGTSSARATSRARPRA